MTRGSGFAVSLLVLSTALSGCAFGHVRQVKMGAPGPYRDVHAVRVETTGGNPALAKTLSGSASGELATAANLAAASSNGEPAFVYSMNVTQATEPGGETTTLSTIGNQTGFASKNAARSGLLSFDATLTAPDGVRVGRVTWEGNGSPAALADLAAFEAAGEIGRRLRIHRNDVVARRPSDERLFLTSTPETLEAGQFAFSNDEALLFRLAAGAGRRTQVDMWGGALPIPIAGGGALFIIRAVGVGGGVGLVVIGFNDIGIKHRFVDEGDSRPAISASYDMLNVFVGGIGAAGVVVGADAIVAGAGGGLGGANAQFNIGTITAGKHFGREARTEVVLGGIVIDNHNILPQHAGFVAGLAGAGTSGSGGGGTLSGGTSVPHLPTQLQGWLSVSQVLGEHSMIATELFPRPHLSESFATTGIRWVVGGSRPWGPFALDRIRLRLDLAAIWLYFPPRADQSNPDGTVTKGHQPFIAPTLPWAGVGLYW